jgi:hypothetical protein
VRKNRVRVVNVEPSYGLIKWRWVEYLRDIDELEQGCMQYKGKKGGYLPGIRVVGGNGGSVSSRVDDNASSR